MEVIRSALGSRRRYPASLQQEELWALCELEQGNPAWSHSGSNHLAGPLDAGALRRAVETLFARHDALRTSLDSDRDGMWQDVWEALPSEAFWSFVDLSSLAPEVRAGAARRMEESEAGRPLDPRAPPLARALLVRISPEQHVFVLTVHHLIADHRAYQVLWEELTVLYSALVQGRAGALPSVAVQYPEFATRQRDPRRWARLERAEAYWRDRLASAASRLRLSDGARESPGARSHEGDRVNAVLGAEEGAVLRSFAFEKRAPRSAAFLAALFALLNRRTGEEDLVVGVHFSGRNAPGLDRAVGHFANTAALRCAVAAEITVSDLLVRVSDELRKAHAHQEVRLGKVLAHARAPRRPGRHPLFEVAFNLLEDTSAGNRFAGLVGTGTEGRPGSTQYSRYDLSLIVQEREGVATIQLEYGAGRFARATAEGMLREYLAILRSLAANPSATVREACAAPAGTEHGLGPAAIVAGPTVVRDGSLTLHGLVEAQARRTPDRIAVTFDGRSMTYRELDARAGALSRLLVERGVGPGTIVGVTLEPELEVPAALLAVLRAGAAYLPLDPRHPADRLAWMVRDAGPRAIVTRGASPELAGVAQVRLDGRERREPGRTSEPAPAGSDHLAYVMYTSGSTGRPKGVMVSHRATCNRLLWMQEAYPLAPEDCVLQKTSFGFDVSVWELFWPLLAGARLAIVPAGTRADARRLVEAIAAERATVVHFVPPMLGALLDERGLEASRGLRRIFCSGEALSPELERRCLERLPAAALHNLYGPTEAAIDVTAWDCARASGRGFVPIGRPIANVRIAILDDRLEPVPQGAVGELCIGGVALARGYLGRPDLTAERFVPDASGTEAGARLYRTGDLARCHADGVIEFLGRADHQVKVRGFRIEPAEIEAALASHPGVSEAVVKAYDPGDGDKRLVAFVVRRAGAECSVRSLRRHLEQRLPAYMVPPAYAWVAAIPRTVHGKVDRAAVVQPAALAADREHVEPRTAAEEALAAIWSEVLGVERVGVEDAFFELGGDSLLALRVIARAADEGLRVTLQQMYRHETLGALAAAATEAAGARAEQGLVTGPVPLPPVHRWFLEQGLADPHHYNQSVTVEAPPDLDGTCLRRAVAHLMVHHDALRLRFRRGALGWEAAQATYEEEESCTELDVSGMAPEEARARFADAAGALQRSLDPSRGPLLRVLHVRRGRGEPGRLVLVGHHLAVDGESWRILLEDLAKAYREIRNGREALLPPKTTSFKAWAERITSEEAVSEAERDLAYWAATCQRAEPRLPRDLPGSAADNTVGAAGRVVVELEPDDTRELLAGAPKVNGARAYEVVLTAAAVALSRWTGRAAVRMDVEWSGRTVPLDEVDLSRTVGWFTTVFPVFVDVDPSGPPADSLRRASEQLRRVPAGGLSYGLLRHVHGDAAIRERLASLPAEVVLTYFGRVGTGGGGAGGGEAGRTQGAAFRVVPEGSGPERSAAGVRPYLLDVDAAVEDGRLRVGWSYGTRLHRRETVERLAAEHLAWVRALLARRDRSAPSPSDFEGASLSHEELSRILAGRAE